MKLFLFTLFVCSTLTGSLSAQPKELLAQDKLHQVVFPPIVHSVIQTTPEQDRAWTLAVRRVIGGLVKAIKTFAHGVIAFVWSPFYWLIAFLLLAASVKGSEDSKAIALSTTSQVFFSAAWPLALLAFGIYLVCEFLPWTAPQAEY